MIKKNNGTDSEKEIHAENYRLVKENEAQAEKIRQLEEDIFKWKSIGNTLPNSIYIKDLQGKYLWVNDVSIKRLIELHDIHTDIIGKKDSDVFPAEAAKNYMENDRLVLQTKKGEVHEEKTRLPNGKESITLSFKEPLYNKTGVISGILGYTIDITELKATQSKLEISLKKAEVANQAKTEFLENMRHDIRTPLSGIIGCAQIIQMQPDNCQKVSEFADDLVHSSNALLEFLNKILESITVANGEIPLLKKKFNLKESLEQIIHLNKPQAVVKELALDLVYAEDVPAYLIGDPIRVQRIMLELLTNALKYTDKGGIKVIARVRKNKKRELIIELSVSDTGMGIPPDKHHEVYTRFKRLTPSYAGIYPGTGLGLSVVKKFIDDLQGEIYIESDVGKGTKFICLLSFQKSLLDENDSEEPDSVSESEIAIAHKRRILVVEDDAIAIKIAKNVLSELGCHIDTALDGRTALEKIEKNDYDLILIDVGLPDGDGDELTRLMRLKQQKQNSEVPIIGLTAHIDAEKKQSCLASGMNAVYTKPLILKKASEILNIFISNQPLTKESLT